MASSNSKSFKISRSCYFYNLGIYCNSDLIKGDKDIFHLETTSFKVYKEALAKIRCSSPYMTLRTQKCYTECWVNLV